MSRQSGRDGSKTASPIFQQPAKGDTEMDLRQYYKKLHEMEAKMTEAHVLVVSVESGDGGREGVFTEVTRRNACQLILDGRAKLADPKEAEVFRSEEAEKREEFQRAKTVSRVQFQIVPNATRVPAPATSGE